MAIHSLPALNSRGPKLNTASHYTPTGGSPRFLELPLEIRRQIYEATLSLCLEDQLSLLSTNHQVYEEGYGFVFRRPLTFSSRLHLQVFVKSHSPDVLGEVRSLRLRLGELAPAAMESYLRNAIMGIPTHLSEHPYVLENGSIFACIRTMPNLKHFSILPPRQRNPNPAPRELVHHLLTQIAQHSKQLESLFISTDLKSVEFLADMPRLRFLRFSGCSSTDSESASLIFSQMPSLQELSIIGPSAAFLKRQKCNLQKGAILALTPDALSRIQPLKRLTIRDLGPPGNPTFFTKDMLMVIYESHRTKLRSLCLCSASQPSIETVGMLKAVLMSLPVLIKVRLEWPCVDAELVSEYLPPTLQSLTVTVQNTMHAREMIDGLMSAAIKLPYLRDVRLSLMDGVESFQGRGNLTPPLNNGSRCGTPAWRTSWDFWQPAGDDDA